MAKARTVYVADFETTTDPDDCRVWAYGICELADPDAFSAGTSIEHFVGIVSREDSVIYFHNLRFDGMFITDWLFRNGFKHVNDRPIGPKEFSTLISNSNQWYRMRICWDNGRVSELRDSLKKLPMPVKRIAESFKLDQAKGEIDYHKPREPGYIPEPEEISYIEADVQIVAKALQVQVANTKNKLTVGADALAEYRDLMGNDRFKATFPTLPLDIDAAIRAGYRGGWTYVREDRRGIVQGAGHVFDVNSLYPAVMYSKLLPYGFPVYFESEPNPDHLRPLWVASVTFTAQLKNNHLPCIQIKNAFRFSDTEYLSVIEEPTTLVMTNVDFELWSRHYDIDVLAWNGGFKFTATVGEFKDYIDKWSQIKANSTGGLREIAKLHLNSLYGKFATNPDITGKEPYLDPETNRVRFRMGPPETRDPVYTPMGVFITAYAREFTINAAQANYDSFAYADTDSLHLITDDWPDLDIDPQRMGAWSHEYSFTRALFVRPKAYSEQLLDGSFETRIAGLPREIAKQVTIDDFSNGRVWHGKKVPRSVPGGVVLTDTEYTLKY